MFVLLSRMEDKVSSLPLFVLT